jgi:DNA-binding response OmpR family regulator
MRHRLVAIVDDDRDTAFALASLLPSQVYRSTCFGGGRPFLEAFDEMHPDAVLLDLSMPDVNGLEVLRSLRQDHASNVPVIVVSGITDAAAFARARKLGATATVKKPVEPDEILDLLDGSLPPS